LSIHGACLLVAALTAAGAASALGFGAASPSVALGQPLSFQTQLQLDAGETLAPGCVRAEVSLGDRMLAAAAVQVDVEPAGSGQWRVRVRSAQVVNEPTVAVQLYAGCPARVSRLFVLMADPSAGASTAAPTGAGLAPDRADNTRPSAAPPQPLAAAAAVPQTVPQRRASLPPAAVSPPAAQRRAAAPARGDAGARAGASARATSPAGASGPRLRLDAADAPPSPAELVAEEVLDQALQAVALAANATRAAQAQAQIQAQRITELEGTVAQLRAQSQAADARSVSLQGRLDQAERESRWFMPLLVGAGVLALLAAWLAWQLNQLQRMRQAGWRQAQAAARLPGEEQPTPSRQPTMPIPLVHAELPGPAGAAAGAAARSTPPWPRAAAADSVLPAADSSTEPGALPLAVAAQDRPARPAGAAAAGAASTSVSGLAVAAAPGRPAAPAVAADAASTQARALQRTAVLPYGRDASGSTPRDVSIEELIDLEQQAEFFVVLGQDESAIDLLVEHLRSTGGGSPLPYLKLLEIYRRRGDREAYERTRTRFNHRFNAYAPEWSADLQHGRTLQDYPEVMPRLQQVWARPLDAMAELEALLFRKSRGELFDLPAYREVLFLYALARDLLDREAADTGSVDLLLPLDTAGGNPGGTSRAISRAASGGPSARSDVADFGDHSTAPGAWSGGDSAFSDDEQRPTAPVDLDLSLPDTPRTSIFDPLTPAGPRR
jgi:hypothetical protein